MNDHITRKVVVVRLSGTHVQSANGCINEVLSAGSEVMAWGTWHCSLSLEPSEVSHTGKMDVGATLD